MTDTSHLFLAKRDNNPHRDFIILNTRQAKHFPSEPNSSLELMEQLGKKLSRDGRAEKPTVIVAFSETATAIGAAVSAYFPDCFFVTTTREPLPDWVVALSFEEIHSHAPLHKLCIREENAFRRASQLILIDDEFTTGNTVINLLKALDGCLSPHCEIIAAALTASEESRKLFRSHGISPVFLCNSEEIVNRNLPEKYSPDREITPRDYDKIIYQNNIFDPALGVNADSYLAEIRELCGKIAAEIPENPNGTVQIIGTEEYAYPPLVLGKMLSRKFGKTAVHCTTRSPMLALEGGTNGFEAPAEGEYPITSRSVLHSVYDKNRRVYLYNSQPCDLTVIMTDCAPDTDALRELCGAVGGNKIIVVCRRKPLPTSYRNEDVKLLLTDITGKLPPLAATEREPLIQSGVHYSELLPAEYRPKPEYLREYENGLKLWAKPVAQAVQTAAEAIYSEKGRNAVLVSLARAGTPAGVLIKDYIREKYGVSLPHYSISIIVGKGIDSRALKYILARHSAAGIQFIDGWTGKGMILRTLRNSLESLPLFEYGIDRSALDKLCEIAVLADPAGLCRLCGTHEDMFIPCACLNSVVSGLFSRTVLKEGLIAPDEFHGAAYFGELAELDRTYEFIDTIKREFDFDLITSLPQMTEHSGMSETAAIAQKFGINDIKLIKPSIGETTRVLLRRVPQLILLRDVNSPLTRHIVELAAEKNVEIRQYPLQNYHACGIIRTFDNV